MSRTLLRVLVPLLAVVANGCDGDDPINPADLPRCDQRIAVTASADTAPVLRWSPACRASFVDVRLALDPGVVVWAVHSPEAMLTPGLRYGAVPEGAIELTPARTLGRDTSWIIGVGHAFGSESIFSTSALGGTVVTACGAMSRGQCVTTPEKFSPTTAEGVRVEASVSPTSVARGDTAWISLRLVNTTQQPVTIATLDECWTSRMDVVPPGPPRLVVYDCETPFAPVSIAAGGTVERRVAFDGFDRRTSGPFPVSCLDAGTWKARYSVNAGVGGLRVRPAEVSWRLVERASARAQCGPS